MLSAVLEAFSVLFPLVLVLPPMELPRIVFPETSSINWIKTFLLLLKTETRGFFLFLYSLLCSRGCFLTGFTLYYLAQISDAAPLVWLGFSQRPYVGRDLSD